MSGPRYRLNLISNPAVNDHQDFLELAGWVAEADADIAARVLLDTPNLERGGESDLLTLTVSPAPIRHFRPDRGPTFQGRRLGKSEEYQRLESIGIRVPRWCLLVPSLAHCPTPAALQQFPEYVVTKPDFGARGADVRVQRRSRLRWAPPKTRQSLALGGPFNPLIVQEFIHTGAWPVSFRVATLFGHTLWAVRVEANRQRRALPNRAAFKEVGDGLSIVSSGRGCTFELLHDAQLLGLAEAAHSAFPTIPLLGVDIVRDCETGELFVIEVNSLGYTWHFSSRSGRNLQATFGIDLEAQFGGRRLAAALLAKACREHAR